MVETLTESFCERCGTRYEFKAPTRLNPLRKTRGLFGGLKNYLTSQDALSDAIGDAMRGEEDQLASAQLEAFHESFNFCISCRQYTCLNCWNDGEGRCRSCAPIPGTDDLAERLAASFNAGGAHAVAEAPLGGPASEVAGPDSASPLGADAWPTVDAPRYEPPTMATAPEAWPVADDLSRWGEGTPAGEPSEDSPWRTPFNEPVAADPGTEPAWGEPAATDLGGEPDAPEPVGAGAEAAWRATFEADDHTPDLWATEADADEAVAAETEPDREPLATATEPEPAWATAEVDPSWPTAETAAEPILPEAEPVAAEVEPEPVAAEVEPEPVAAEVEAQPEGEPAWPDVVAAEVEPVPPEVPAPRVLRVLAWDDDVPAELLLRAEAEAELTDEDAASEAAAPELESDREPVAAEALGEPVATELTQPPAAEAVPEPPAVEVTEPIAAEVGVGPAPAEADPQPERAAAEVEREPEPAVADAVPEPIAAEAETRPEVDPVAATVEPVQEPEAPRPAPTRIAPIRETILRFPERPAAAQTSAPSAAEQDSPEVAARRAQLDLLGLGDPGQGPVPPERPVVMPYRSRGAPGGQIAVRASGGGFWEASAREVAGAAANIGVQNCGQCGLSLSANARFCRRCGTRQAQSA